MKQPRKELNLMMKNMKNSSTSKGVLPPFLPVSHVSTPSALITLFIAQNIFVLVAMVCTQTAKKSIYQLLLRYCKPKQTPRRCLQRKWMR